MKLKLKAAHSLIPGQIFWQVTTDKGTTSYETFAGAFEFCKKKLKRAYKEQAAYSRALTLDILLLNIQDAFFVRKMLKCKCKGITKRQYGYLAGIHERQKADF